MLCNSASGGSSCADVYMESGFVAIFLGFENLWYLLFRENRRKQAKIQGNVHNRRDILYERQTNTASYITIKIVISYKISRIFFFFLSFSLQYTLNWTEIIFPQYTRSKTQKFFPFSQFFLHFCCSLYDVGIPTDLFLYYISSSFRLMWPSTVNCLRFASLASAWRRQMTSLWFRELPLSTV